MGKIILVTGGARSGKSSFAEGLAKELGGEKVVYVATAVPFDDEMKERVRKHREQRPPTWKTIEAYRDLGIELEGNMQGSSALMLDCITVMITNLMYDKCTDFENISNKEIAEVEAYVKAQIGILIDTAKQSKMPFVLVTNEIGMGIVPEYKSARVFRDLAGRANQLIAKAADEVYLCVSGIPMKIK